MHPALPAVSQDELGPQLHLLLSSFFDWLKPAHSSMQYMGQVTSHRSHPMQVTASRRDLREVRRITEEEGEVKVCHVIIKRLVSTLVLPVCHWSLDRAHNGCADTFTRQTDPSCDYQRNGGVMVVCLPFSGPGLIWKEAAQALPALATCL